MCCWEGYDEVVGYFKGGCYKGNEYGFEEELVLDFLLLELCGEVCIKCF